MGNKLEKLKHRKHQDKEVVYTAEGRTTITDICYDCLERIFDLLDIENLMNVAGTCKWLRIQAAQKFGHDFGKKKIFLVSINGIRLI